MEVLLATSAVRLTEPCNCNSKRTRGAGDVSIITALRYRIMEYSCLGVEGLDDLCILVVVRREREKNANVSA